MIDIGNALILADEAAFQGSSNGLFSFFSNTNGTGLPILDSSLTAITQALQIPVIILLIAFLVFQWIFSYCSIKWDSWQIGVFIL